MSSGSVRRVSRQDIQLVQNLIEQCLQLYMNQKEVVETLLVKAKIEPGFTDLVLPSARAEIKNLNRLWHPWEREKIEFFALMDLWQRYDEWSAYGAGVPIVLMSWETLVQYYVHYLSAIQIFTISSFVNSFREEAESGDCEMRDLYSDSCSDESEKLSRLDVWQKLEEENQEFFKAYYLRLTVKHQITEFNKLLEQQVHLMHQMHPGSVPALPSTNGTHVSQLQQNFSCYAADRSGNGVAENIHLPVGATIVPGTFTNGGAALPASLQAPIEMSSHINRIDAASNMLHNQSQNMGLISGMNGGSMIKNEASNSGGSYIFGAGGNVPDARPTIGGLSVPSFSSVDSTPHPLNEPLLDTESSSFDFLGSIPRNFSLSDLTADFSQSSDILEYPRSPFLGPDAEHFLESRDRGEQGDNRRLNPITENLSYDDFGSE